MKILRVITHLSIVGLVMGSINLLLICRISWKTNSKSFELKRFLALLYSCLTKRYCYEEPLSFIPRSYSLFSKAFSFLLVKIIIRQLCSCLFLTEFYFIIFALIEVECFKGLVSSFQPIGSLFLFITSLFLIIQCFSEYLNSITYQMSSWIIDKLDSYQHSRFFVQLLIFVGFDEELIFIIQITIWEYWLNLKCF